MRVFRFGAVRRFHVFRFGVVVRRFHVFRFGVVVRRFHVFRFGVVVRRFHVFRFGVVRRLRVFRFGVVQSLFNRLFHKAIQFGIIADLNYRLFRAIRFGGAVRRLRVFRFLRRNMRRGDAFRRLRQRRWQQRERHQRRHQQSKYPLWNFSHFSPVQVNPSFLSLFAPSVRGGGALGQYGNRKARHAKGDRRPFTQRAVSRFWA